MVPEFLCAISAMSLSVEGAYLLRADVVRYASNSDRSNWRQCRPMSAAAGSL
jgi:hypothetical protein